MLNVMLITSARFFSAHLLGIKKSAHIPCMYPTYIYVMRTHFFTKKKENIELMRYRLVWKEF